MLNLSLAQIASIVAGKLHGSGEAIVETAVSDSRQAAPGRLFVAIKGDRVDGHQFVEAALAAGASGIMTETFQIEAKPQIVVADCRRALADLARFQLRRYPVKVIAVTGSVGKTSCKDLLAAVLSTRYKVLKNEGNRNTEITLPFTLFELAADHQIAVLEMGMVAQGEISELCAIAPPDIAMISNILEVHLERLGSLQAIAATKGEIFDALSESGIALVNNDDPLVVAEAENIRAKCVSYGIERPADLMVAEIQSLGIDGSRFTVSFPDGQLRRMMLPLPGEHMVHNALPAILAGYLLGISPEEIAAGLASATASGQRLDIRYTATGQMIIDDSYNANPRSMAVALRLIAEVRQERPVYLILGDMLELGEVSLEAHRLIGELAADIRPELLITCGALAAEIGCAAVRSGLDSKRTLHCQDNQAVLRALHDSIPANALLLIKGSRGMQMEEIVRGLEAR